MSTAVLTELKEKLSHSLVSLEQLRPPAGLPTGLDVFDDFLLWRGIPKGDLTLLNGKPGAGATSLWIHTAQKIHEQNKWVAWINSDWELLPSYLLHKKINLKRLLVVKKPKESSQMFWILQELITSSLFEMVGCHLPETFLKNHQLQKLKKLARLHQVALVIICHAKHWSSNPIFSLVIDCARDFFTIRRALHRPTPFSIQGSFVHADFRNQLSSHTRAILC
jgi:recombination protein RecA